MKIKNAILITSFVIILIVISYYLYSFYSNNQIGNYIFGESYQDSLQKPALAYNLNITNTTGTNRTGIVIYAFWEYKDNLTDYPILTLAYRNDTISSCNFSTGMSLICRPYSVGDKNTTIQIRPNNTLINNGQEVIVSIYENSMLFSRCSALQYKNRIFVYYQVISRNISINITLAEPNDTNANICTYTVDFKTNSIKGSGVSN